MTAAHDIACHAAQYCNYLPIAVEQVLLGLRPGKTRDTAPEQFDKIGDAANAAMAIAAYAALAWTICHLPAPNGLDAASRDLMIVIIVEEAMKK